MKKAVVLCALVFCILAGLVSGTFALYTKTVTVNSGTVYAAKFRLVAAKSTGYSDNVLISPGETKTAAFTVSNSDGTDTSETNMDLVITVDVAAASGKTAIPYITATLLDANDNPIGGTISTVSNGTGTITLNMSRAFTAAVASTRIFKIKFTWVSNSNDINYQGPNFGTAYTVTVTGNQSPPS